MAELSNTKDTLEGKEGKREKKVKSKFQKVNALYLQPGEEEKEGGLQTFSGSNGVLLQRRQPAIVQVPCQDLCQRPLGPNSHLPELQQGD